jgi:hypothetical protein
VNTIGRAAGQANQSSEAKSDLMWVQAVGERHCGRCGAVVRCWVLHSDHGHRVAEATFCAACHPDLERIFHPRGQAPNAA